MDYLKELSLQLDGRIKSQELLNINLNESSFRRLIVKDYKQLKIQIDEYRTLYSIGIKVNSILTLSINKPDRIFLFNTPKALPGLPYKIYVSSDYNLSPNEHFKRFWNFIIELLQKLKLSGNESIFIYRNYIFFVLNPNRDLSSILDDIIALIKANDKIFKKDFPKKISVKGIPNNLKPLLPFLKFSVSDDVEREQLIDEMEVGQKKKLVNAVDPFMHEINQYLSSFRDQPLDEVAILIQDLAELVSELKMRKTD
jgi:hypothetical protein